MTPTGIRAGAKKARRQRMNSISPTQTLGARRCALHGGSALLMLVAATACAAAPEPAPARPPPGPPDFLPIESAGIEPVKEATPAAIVESDFGIYDGKPIKLFTLTNENGLVLKAMTYGAIITEFHVPDRQGKPADIVLGFDDLSGYVEGRTYFGATVGRVA